ncbi:MAG: COQ9 family protein [Thiohalocapsa sp.]
MRSPLAEQERERLVVAMLPDVAFDGWGRASLRHAARRTGIPVAEALALFPRGGADMVAAFSRWADHEMLQLLAAVAAEALEPVGLSARIALALSLRFEVLMPWREAVRRSLAVLAMPQNGPLGLRLLYETVDAMWRGVGDHASDFSFYTKRASLAAVQAAATLYWLEDRSPDMAETRAFIDRRLADLHRIGGMRERLSAAVEALPNPLRVLRPSR